MASFIVVGVMAVIALGILEPANIAVLFEMRKPRPNGEVIAKLMKRFIYTAGITGLMQVATLDHHDPGGLPMSVPSPDAPAGRHRAAAFAPVAEIGAAALVLSWPGASTWPRTPRVGRRSAVPIGLAAASGVLSS